MKNSLIEKITSKIKNTPKMPITYVLYILDSSGSMHTVEKTAKQFVIKNVDELFNSAKELNQYAYASLMTFADVVSTPTALIDSKAFINDRLNRYCCMGWTALNDAIINGIDFLEKNCDSNSVTSSFLVVIVTDGIENRSYNKTSTTGAKIRHLMDKGNWTFAFNGPPGSKSIISMNYNIPKENINEWEGQDALESSTITNMASTRSYIHERSQGKTQSVNYFTKVDPNDINYRTVSKLTDVSKDFSRYEVTRSMQIRDFVHSKGHAYVKGKAYYELTKTEELQEYKDVLVFEKKTGSIYKGNEARIALGIPLGIRVKVSPVDHSDKYSIFINSTSYNRKLVPGTVLLYKN